MNPFAILPHMSCYAMKKCHSQASFRFIQSFSATESLEYLDLDRSPLKQLSITQNNSHLRGVKNTDDLRISLVEIKFINSRCWRPLYFGQNNQNLVIDSWPKLHLAKGGQQKHCGLQGQEQGFTLPFSHAKKESLRETRLETYFITFQSQVYYSIMTRGLISAHLASNP